MKMTPHVVMLSDEMVQNLINQAAEMPDEMTIGILDAAKANNWPVDALVWGLAIQATYRKWMGQS